MPTANRSGASSATGGAASESAPSDMVGKALLLVELLAEHPHGETVSDLSREAGLPLTTTHRLLGSLQRQGFVECHPRDRRYSLGLKLFEIGKRVSHARGLSGVAIPVLTEVTRTTNESAVMSVLDQDQQLFVHVVDGPQMVQFTGRPGDRSPLHCTAVGKVLLAFQRADERERLLAEIPLTKFTKNSITTRSRLRKEINEVREAGFSVADEEHEPGIRSIGVPVLDVEGVAFAGVSIACPAYRVSVRDLHKMLPALRAGSEQLAARLPQP